MNADPLTHVDLLATDYQRRPMGKDRLEFESHRHITVADQERFRQTLADPHRDDSDITELLVELRNNREGGL